MISCWKLDSYQRPRFTNLQRVVSELLEAEAGYMELSSSLMNSSGSTGLSVIVPVENSNIAEEAIAEL